MVLCLGFFVIWLVFFEMRFGEMKGVLKIVLLFVVLVSMIVGCGFDSIFVIFFGEIGFWDLGDEWDSDVGGVDDLGVFIDFGV